MAEKELFVMNDLHITCMALVDYVRIARMCIKFSELVLRFVLYKRVAPCVKPIE